MHVPLNIGGNDLVAKTRRIAFSMKMWGLENPFFAEYLKHFEEIGTGIAMKGLDPAMRLHVSKVDNVELLNPLDLYPTNYICVCKQAIKIERPGNFQCPACLEVFSA